MTAAVAVGPVLARAAGCLAAAGVASPRTDAEVLAAHVLGVPRGRLVLAAGFRPRELARFDALLARRAAREPLQHLTGRAGFAGLELAVGPGVFVPRPETELLAEWAVAQLRRAGGEPVVVDLCSGGGALALAIAYACPAARVVAVERAAAARRWLRRNAAARVRAGDRPVEVVTGDATDPDLLAGLAAGVDLLVCNPPYVPAPVAAGLPPEVTVHDPPEAVFAGPDGLAVIRPVIDRAARLLRPGGRFGVEHDESHAGAVPALLAGRFEAVRVHPDLAGRPRFTTAARVAD